MADNIQLNANISAGSIVATDEVGGFHYQGVKVFHGGDAEGGAQAVYDFEGLPTTEVRRGSVPTPLYRYLDTVGNGTGTKQATGDYSGAEEIFFIQPSGVIYRIERLIVYMEDTAGFQAEEYGNLGIALANGIQVRVQNDGGTVTDLTNGIKVKTNGGWGRTCYDVTMNTWGAGDECLLARWTFTKAGYPLRINGSGDTERLEVTLNDDLSGLIEHTFMAQGYIEVTPS